MNFIYCFPVFTVHYLLYSKFSHVIRITLLSKLQLLWEIGLPNVCLIAFLYCLTVLIFYIYYCFVPTYVVFLFFFFAAPYNEICYFNDNFILNLLHHNRSQTNVLSSSSSSWVWYTTVVDIKILKFQFQNKN